MAFDPPDPKWEPRVRQSFADQALMHTMGVRIESCAPGCTVLEMPFNPDFAQQHGFVHAGAITSLVDTACGFAAASLMPPDGEVLTVEFKVSLFAPAKGQSFRAEGNVIKPGRTLFFTEGRVFAVNNGSEREIAMMTATMICVADRPLR